MIRRKFNTGGGDRTHTGITPQRILSPQRLPFRHAGTIQIQLRPDAGSKWVIE